MFSDQSCNLSSPCNINTPKEIKLLYASALFVNIHHRKIKTATIVNLQFSSALFRKSTTILPTRPHCLLAINGAFKNSEILFSGFTMYFTHFLKLMVTFCFYWKIMKGFSVCLILQYAAQCGLSIPAAGANWSSRLWEKRASSQTVPRVLWLLLLWVSLNHFRCLFHMMVWDIHI